jgi:hypothetical protein
MTDTSSAVEEELRTRYRARTPAARLRMATAMFATAKRLAAAGLHFGGAGPSRIDLRRGLLDRLYGDELTPAQRAEIAARPVPE